MGNSLGVYVTAHPKEKLILISNKKVITIDASDIMVKGDNYGNEIRDKERESR